MGCNESKTNNVKLDLPTIEDITKSPAGRIENEFSYEQKTQTSKARSDSLTSSGFGSKPNTPLTDSTDDYVARKPLKVSFLPSLNPSLILCFHLLPSKPVVFKVTACI